MFPTCSVRQNYFSFSGDAHKRSSFYLGWASPYALLSGLSIRGHISRGTSIVSDLEAVACIVRTSQSFSDQSREPKMARKTLFSE